MMLAEISRNNDLIAMLYLHRTDEIIDDGVFLYECEVYTPGQGIDKFELRHVYADGYKVLISAILQQSRMLMQAACPLPDNDVRMVVTVNGALLCRMSLKAEQETIAYSDQCSHWLEVYEPGLGEDKGYLSQRLVHRKSDGYHSLLLQALAKVPGKKGKRVSKNKELIHARKRNDKAILG